MQAREEAELEQLNDKKMQETYDRLTAVTHVNVEHFSKHKKIEGYYENRMMPNMLGCDRLMVMEHMFGKVQFGYNPNRGRSFVFANLKTSRYDTVSSRYQKQLAQYQMKALQKGSNQNRAFIAQRKEMTSVLLEKSEAQPWTQKSVAPYLGRVNMEALRKTMPFFDKASEQDALRKKRIEFKSIKDNIADQYRTQGETDMVSLNKEYRKTLTQTNLIESLIQRKDAGSKYFLRKLNYAFDIQKHEMFEYYKDKRSKLEENSTHEVENDEPDENKDNA